MIRFESKYKTLLFDDNYPTNKLDDLIRNTLKEVWGL